MDWFLYDIGLRHEMVKVKRRIFNLNEIIKPWKLWPNATRSFGNIWKEFLPCSYLFRIIFWERFQFRNFDNQIRAEPLFQTVFHLNKAETIFIRESYHHKASKSTTVVNFLFCDWYLHFYIFLYLLFEGITNCLAPDFWTMIFSNKLYLSRFNFANFCRIGEARAKKTFAIVLMF